jgi:membrane-associated phospholipid phosphatase
MNSHGLCEDLCRHARPGTGIVDPLVLGAVVLALTDVKSVRDPAFGSADVSSQAALAKPRWSYTGSSLVLIKDCCHFVGGNSGMKFVVVFFMSLLPVFAVVGSLHAEVKFTLLSNLAGDFKYLATSPSRLDKKSVLITLGAIGIGVGLYLKDEKIRDFFQDNQNSFFDGLAPIAEQPGFWPAGLGFLALFGGTGYLMKNEKMQETAFLSFESFLVADAITVSLKYGTGRARPKRERGSESFKPFSFATSDTGFPSGHTTVAFSIASVFADEYKSPYVGLFAYSLASLTALERLYDDKHWASDVWVGFLVGTVVGKSVVYLHKKTDFSVLVLPLCDPSTGTYGVAMVGRF